MKIDTTPLFHRANTELAQVQRAIEDAMIPQCSSERLEERRRLRIVKDAILLVERYALEETSPANGSGDQA